MNNFDAVLVRKNFSPEEQGLFLQKTWDLLKIQAEKYNGFDSTSMTVEKAQDLLASIVYSLSLVIDQSNLSAEAIIQQDFSTLLGQAQTILETKWKALYSVWNEICLEAPEINNFYYISTLKEIGIFFKKYDFHYEAHRVPCNIDYPLIKAIPDNLKGINYIEAYLKSIRIENQYVKKYAHENVLELLQEMASEYEENYFNFCECVFVNALGKEMVSSGKDSLFIDEEELHRFSAEYIGKTAEEINEILEKSAVSIFRKIGFDENNLPYFSDVISSLALRICEINKPGFLKNVFIVKNGTGTSTK